MESLNINDYKYDLPAERIALHPLANRDESKLLVWRSGNIQHSKFSRLVSFLPENSFLFFNDTKVIPARLHFKKATGADIEVFLLSPIDPSSVISEVMASTTSSTWKCTIGNLKRWSSDAVLVKEIRQTKLEAKLIDRDSGIVQFTWNSGESFAAIISESGETPLPPYLKRNVEQSDRERYQTVYSHYEGAVAAPTAGLHFTENTFKDLQHRNIAHDFLTLHVSAGTFQPVKAANINDHIMHAEQVVVTEKNIDNLLQHGKFFLPVGTTSMRTLESVYWFGVKLLNDSKATFKINQHDPYTNKENPPTKDAIGAVKKFMERTNQKTIVGETSIFIRPGYQFKVCRGLITNFHQPGSTLMLLVAALTGEDWKKIYKEAMDTDYRFLSYGDSSLLFP
jgi:S-adenosylmethionine:tRNA ribosyltransferase-isomerase